MSYPAGLSCSRASKEQEEVKWVVGWSYKNESLAEENIQIKNDPSLEKRSLSLIISLFFFFFPLQRTRIEGLMLPLSRDRDEAGMASRPPLTVAQIELGHSSQPQKRENFHPKVIVLLFTEKSTFLGSETSLTANCLWLNSMVAWQDLIIHPHK